MAQDLTKIPYRGRADPVPDGNISISKTGRIGLTSRFVEKHGVAKGDRAALYWGDDEQRIVFAFTGDDSAAYPVVSIGSSGGRYINAAKFFRAIGVDPSEYDGTREYKTVNAHEVGLAAADAKGDVFVVQLDGAETASLTL